MSGNNRNSSNNNNFDENFASGRRPNSRGESSLHTDNDRYKGFATKGDYIWDKIMRYMRRVNDMLGSSLAHLSNPFTIIVIILLAGFYILLGVAGSVQFSFYSGEVVQYINTNLDIIVNAFLGFFYGPVTCAISVGICCVVRILANKTPFFIGYVIGAVIAGFIHGWILYRLKKTWFKPRFFSFHGNLLYNILKTRLVVSAFVNIILMSAIYKLFINYPITEYIRNYSKAGVPLNSAVDFLKVFFISIFFETIVVFLSITVANYIAGKAFPDHFAQASIVISKNGEIEDIDDDDYDD